MRKVIVRDPVIYSEYTAWFHEFDSTEDSVYAIVEDDSTGIIRVVDVTAVRFLNDPNGKNITTEVESMRKVMVSEEKWNIETKKLERIDLYEAWFHQFGNDECGENNSVTVAIVERIDNGQVEVVFPGNIRFIDANEEYERWIDERDSVVKLLRTVCAEHGDNDWPDNLHLYDVIEKHLFLNLEESKRNKLSGALSDQEIIAIAESMPEGVKAFGVNWGFIKLARAIEAAHGIGE